MLSPRWRKVVRDVWLHKARTLLVMLAIATGVMGAGSVLTTWGVVRSVVEVGYRASNPASATLRVDSIDAALLERVQAMPEVESVQARRSVSARARVGASWQPIILYAQDDFASMRIAKVAQDRGPWPPPNGSIAIERSSLEISGTGIGESLLVRVGDVTAPARALPVTSIARDVGLAPGWMEHVIYAFATPATLERLGVPSYLDQLQLVVRDHTLDQEGVRRIAFSAKTLIEAQGHRVLDVAVPVPGRHIHADQMNSLLYTQAGFGVLALLLSCLVVINLIEAMLAGQVREIGVMKTLGAGSRQLAGMYLALAFGLGAIASLLAVPVAAAIGGQYAEFTASMLNFDARGAPVPAWVIAVELVVGAGLPMLAAAIPVMRGSRISVADALRDLGTSAKHDRGGDVFANVRGLSRPLLLSLRNAFRRRRRMILTLATLATGGAVFLGALNLRASIRATMDSTFAAMKLQMQVQLSRAVPAQRLEAAVRNVSGVRLAEAWSGGGAVVSRPDGTFGNSFPVSAVPANTTLLSYPVLRGRWLQPSDTNALVVSARLAEDDPALQLGQEVTLVVRGRERRWQIVGVIAGFLATSFATPDAWAIAAGDTNVARAAVAATTTGPIPEGELQRRLVQELTAQGFEVASVGLVSENRASVEDHLLMVANFLSIMGWVMIVVGGLALASTMSLAVLERTREIGVLRAIGARHSSIHLIVQSEGLVVGLLSWIIAIPLSIGMSEVLARAFARVFFRTAPVFAPDFSALLLWLGLVIVVSVLACAWPAMRATRISAREALAYE